LRGSDLIGRFGGDEFAVIMCGTPPENAIAAMERVHDRLTAFRLPSAPQLALQISVGVAPLTDEMTHYREWLKSADLALYKAKKPGAIAPKWLPDSSPGCYRPILCQA
jgi:diguanylate cyclase